MKSERKFSALWMAVWPMACMVLLAAGVAGVIPNGAVLAIGPVVMVLWLLAVRERFRRRD